MKDLKPRLLSGIVYIGLIIFGTTGAPWLFAILMGFFMAMCLIEFIRITKLFDKLYLAMAVLGSGGVFYYFLLYLLKNQAPFVAESLSFAGPVMFILACYTIMFSSGELKIEFGKATVAVIYIAVPFSLALTLPGIQYELGKEVITGEILMIFILIWVSDTMAYIVGNLMGKRKLVPGISGGKTVEGAIGGVVFTILAGWIIQMYFPVGNRMNWLAVGAIVAVGAPIGDLVESKLKRVFHVKDSGKWIPGHGGFLDRLDSFLFVIPMVYLYLLLKVIL